MPSSDKVQGVGAYLEGDGHDEHVGLVEEVHEGRHAPLQKGCRFRA